MDDKPVEWQARDYRRAFPWVHLFRAFRIAVDFRKLILAGLALVVLAAGNRAFSYLPFVPEAASNVERNRPWRPSFGYEVSPRGLLPVREAEGLDGLSGENVLENPAGVLFLAASNWSLILRPLDPLLESAAVLFRADKTWGETAYAWTRLLWAVIVWAIFGGAITRMTAVQFARDENVGMWAALKFSGSRFLSYLAAPLLPFVGIGLFWLLCLLGGLVGRIPQVGEVLVGVFWFLPLIFAFVMALIVLGVAAGWPLMFAAISTEGSDAFDGFSRSYSYVYGRPWHYLWYAVVSMTYGSIVVFFVWTVAVLIAYLAGWGVASGMGSESTSALFATAPGLLGGSDLLTEQAGRPGTFGAQLVGGWLAAAATLVVGFVYSFFWTAATISYFLLRKAEDATELDEVFVPQTESDEDLLPLAGVAEAEEREKGREQEPEDTPEGESDDGENSGEPQK